MCLQIRQTQETQNKSRNDLKKKNESVEAEASLHAWASMRTWSLQAGNTMSAMQVCRLAPGLSTPARAGWALHTIKGAPNSYYIENAQVN